LGGHVAYRDSFPDTIMTRVKSVPLLPCWTWAVFLIFMFWSGALVCLILQNHWWLNQMLDVQTSYYCRCRLQPERMYQHFAQAKYHFLFPSQQLRVLSSKSLRMTNCNGRCRACNLYLQSHLSCPPGYFRQIQQRSQFLQNPCFSACFRRCVFVNNRMI
jgi:hypothetical protein